VNVVSSSSSSGGTSLAGHSHLHKFLPLGTVLCMLSCRVEAEIVLLDVELNRSNVVYCGLFCCSSYLLHDFSQFMVLENYLPFLLLGIQLSVICVNGIYNRMCNDVK